ncbi:MAG: hypothetical protein ACR2HR_04380 [Euzebya sp.]
MAALKASNVAWLGKWIWSAWAPKNGVLSATALTTGSRRPDGVKVMGI